MGRDLPLRRGGRRILQVEEWYVTQYKPAYQRHLQQVFLRLLREVRRNLEHQGDYVELLRLCSMTTAREIAEELREAKPF